MTTPQETFWRGEFGDEYTERCADSRHVAGQVQFFLDTTERIQWDVRSILELGANVGHNLVALRRLFPWAELTAVEINAKAAKECKRNNPDATVLYTSILDFRPTRTWDLVFTYGVLIHMPPEELPKVYDLMYRASSYYILLAEYYNPKPVEVPYRGHAGKLFKRDFAGEMMDRHPDLKLLDYGFVYHRDPHFPADDVTWFLLSK